MRSRRRKLIQNCKKTTGCNTLVTFEPENLFYLTGFWGEAMGILDKDANATIIAPELEVGRAKDESINCSVIKSDRGISSLNSLKKILKGKVCTDCQNYSVMQSLKKSFPKIKNSVEPFQKSREIKDDKEIILLKKASKIIDSMFGICQKKIRVGLKESELQSILMSYAIENEMFDTGYRSTLNPLIIAGGPNGALPHAQVTNRKFRKGDLIVVDLTLRYKGYVSDSTRTFALGKISTEAEKVFDIVKESQEIGLGTVRPKVNCKTVDDACRKVINESGYGKYFIHSTGHGIGLDVHELPTISTRSTTKLQNNMAITVEPGIYVENKFGVRIEDSLIVKDKKPVVMHKFTKELVTL